MTKETKIGLLVGMGVIILIGILISDHLSVAQRQQQAQLANGIPEIHQDMIPPPPQVARDLPQAQATRRTEPMPLPDELPATVTRETLPTPAPAPSAATANPGVQVAAADPKPHTIYQDVTTLLDERPVAVTQPVMPSAPAAVQGYRPIPSDPGAAIPPGFEVVPAQPAPRVPGVQEAKAIVHYVGKEETLSDISRKYYGSAGAWKDIYEANRSVIPNPNLVRPGVRLVIPPKPGTPSANVAASAGSNNTGTAIRITAERPAPAPAMKTYTVKSGDTLSDIADRFTGSAANWKKVYAANKDRIKDPDRLSEGTVLQIPAN